MKIFDSHTHLNDEAFFGKIDSYNQNAKNLDVVKIANVGSNYELNDGALALSDNHENMYSIIGWHPEDAAEFDAKARDYLIEKAKNDKVVAIGEIGLDYHWDGNPDSTVQKRVFREQLEIANQLELPVSIHCREAYEDAYEIFKTTDTSNSTIIMHSFNGNVEWLNKFLDMGMMISYSGVVSFKNAKEVHESAKNTPLDRMMVETDAPYLTPEPHRGEQNEPAYSRYVVEALAKLRDDSVENIGANTYQNTCRVFGIDDE